MFNLPTPTNNDWAVEEFGSVDFNDTRLNRRCQQLVGELAQQPTKSINQACEDAASVKAAYRFVDNRKVIPAQILLPHKQQTVDRMEPHPVVLAVQDTSFTNHTHHPKTKGLGAIGKKSQGQQGMGLHTTLALTTSGLPIGILGQQFFTRPIGEPSHTPQELAKLPIEEKESNKWLEAMRNACALAPKKTNLVHIADREADIYEFMVEAKSLETDFLVRASFDRRLMPATVESEAQENAGEEAQINKLWAKLETQPIAGYKSVNVEPNQTRKGRTAQVSLRFSQVQLRPPRRTDRVLPPLTIYAVLVREEIPPQGQTPIEWLLLTSVEVADLDQALELVQWYEYRWQIETFHKILKSGCTIEDTRLQTIERLQNYITLMSVVAWRLHFLTYINRTEPEEPCTRVLTEAEWQALYMRIHKTTRVPHTPPTVRQAVRWIAQLGGFLARKGDGEPGVTVIWRGWHRLQDMAATWDIIKNQGLS